MHPVTISHNTASARPALTVEEFARAMSLNPVFTRRMFTRGLIPGAIRIGRVWRLPAHAFDRILETGLPGIGGAR